MENTNSFAMQPFNFDMTGQDPSAMFRLELSEIGNPVPFKIIKLEPPGEPDLIKMEISDQPEWVVPPQDIPGPSNVSSDQPIAAKRKSQPGPKSKQRRVDNDSQGMSSDDDRFSSESDMENGNNSESDSECEELSDSDDQFAPCNTCHSHQPSDGPPPFAWSSEPSMKKIKFTKKRQLFVPPAQEPCEAFFWFLNDEILDVIIEATNKYAANICSKPSIAPQSRFRAWKDLTRHELRTFIALLIHTGTIRTNRICDYWKGDYLFNLTCFSKFMTRNRFMLIFNCFNIALADEKCPRDKVLLPKIRPIVDNYNKTINKIYYPGKELYVAKSMVLWHGKLVRQEYTDHHRHRTGINIYTLAEPNGAVVKYHIYAGTTNDYVNKVSTGEIVMELVREKLGNGHAVYMDRYYTSCKLAHKLLENNTYCTGTLNKKSRDNPFRRNAEHNDVSLFFDGVHVSKWREFNKNILYISTEFDGTVQSVIERYGNVITKPKALVSYKKCMTGTSLQDQLMAYHPCSRKSMRWYKKLFIHSLQIYMTSAYHLYNSYCEKKRKLNYYEFRIQVLKAMLPDPAVLPPRTITMFHALTKITRTKSQQKKDKDGTVRTSIKVIRKMCKTCKLNKKRTVTIYECSGCAGSPGFCTKCFCDLHSSNPDQTVVVQTQ